MRRENVETASNPFFGGVPLRADVEKLEAHFTTYEEGTVFSWDEIESVLDLKRTSHRLKAVVVAWKKSLYDNGRNIFLVSSRNTGYVVATPNQRIAWCGKAYASARKSLFKVSDVASNTDRMRLTGSYVKESRKYLIDVSSRLRLLESASVSGSEAAKKKAS